MLPFVLPAIGAATGAGLGALLDKKHRGQGALLGGLLGLGGGVGLGGFMAQKPIMNLAAKAAVGSMGQTVGDALGKGAEVAVPPVQNLPPFKQSMSGFGRYMAMAALPGLMSGLASGGNDPTMPPQMLPIQSMVSPYTPYRSRFGYGGMA